ncbi:MAG: phosphoribosylamine--glycine ligase [Clostridia bacterium]|nr:phosphoribosylamine--glycine ligase [Clostridia bacterium]
MNILVVGSGGREHAIIRKLKEDPRVETVYCAPGNGGIARDAELVDIPAMDIAALVEFAKANDIGLAVVAPDDPLVAGAVDALEQAGTACFGPRKAAAQLEGSKIFAKEFMHRNGIPTGSAEVFEDPQAALAYVREAPLPVVVKADGLALGKGVRICETREAAEAAVRAMMQEKAFGKSGERIVVEEFLTGPEVSVLAFTDGSAVAPMVSSMDHKRALDGDQGLNTGGMGTIAPNPYYTEEIAEQCMREIFQPTVDGMREEGRPFKGCLYFGLMLTPDGPKVIEYNCRFGDPEAQVVLPLLETSLLDAMLAVSGGTLDPQTIRNRDKSACCVIVASGGYPESYGSGFPISLPEPGSDEEIFVAGAREQDGGLVTAGGRVLGVTAVADTLEEAVQKAYGLAEQVRFEGAYMRRDIGRRALEADQHGKDRI